MSAVQEFLYSRLAADSGVNALVGSSIFDAAQAGDLPELSVLIGGEEVLDASDTTASARVHRAEVDIVARSGGFAQAKDTADVIRAALNGASGPAGAGQITRCLFRRTQALRDTSDGLRRIRMRFDIFFDGL
ncbi:MAG: DUF3168 domain-containing protein [Pseudomonadota bacterium]